VSAGRAEQQLVPCHLEPAVKDRLTGDQKFARIASALAQGDRRSA
jgi:hypothetical protein